MTTLKKISCFVVPLLGATTMACEPTPDELELYDQMVVSTNYDNQVDFSAYTTYSLMEDTIGLVSNYAYDDTIIVSSYASKVVDVVTANLNAAGYQQVAATEEPDWAVNIIILKNLNLYQQVNYVPGYYGYGGGYSYYNYYSNYYVSTYVQNTGTLVVEIVDLKNITNNQAKILWNAYMGDIYGTLDLAEQSIDAIDQAFAQSPYIGRAL